MMASRIGAVWAFRVISRLSFSKSQTFIELSSLPEIKKAPSYVNFKVVIVPVCSSNTCIGVKSKMFQTITSLSDPPEANKVDFWFTLKLQTQPMWDFRFKTSSFSQRSKTRIKQSSPPENTYLPQLDKTKLLHAPKCFKIVAFSHLFTKSHILTVESSLQLKIKFFSMLKITLFIDKLCPTNSNSCSNLGSL